MKKPTKSVEAAPAIPQAKTGTTGTRFVEQRPASYVVVRDGYRVSDREYQTEDDPFAVAEWTFWAKVENNHSWGAKVNIVQYDPKKHRTW